MVKVIGHIAFFVVLAAVILVFSPAKFIITFLLLGVFLYVLFSQFSPTDQRFLCKWILIALAIRLAAALCINTLLPETYDGFFFPDARSYHSWGEKIAALWCRGTFPDLYRAPWLRTFHTAYYRIIAGLYFVFGVHKVVPIILNCISSSLGIVFVFHIATLIFSSRRVGIIATILYTFHPSLWFWSAFLLKDTLHIFFFLWAILLFLFLIRKYDYWLMIALVVLLYFIFRVRVYGSFMLVLTFGIYLLIKTKRPTRVLVTIAAGGIALIPAIVFIPEVRTIYERLSWSFLHLLPDKYNTTIPHIYVLFIAGILKFLLAPFAWVMRSDFNIHLLLYPGQWYLYILLLPYALAGGYYIVKRNLTEGIVLILPIIFSLYLFLLVYQGAVPRQRLFLEVLMLILAAFGYNEKPSRRYLAIYYIVFATGIIAHLASLLIRYGTLIP